MNPNPLAQSLAVILAIMLASSPALPSGQLLALRATGIVIVNTLPMPDGGTVRSGDLISTLDPAQADISSPSLGRVQIRSRTRARLRDGEIELQQGVVASTGAAVRAGPYLIRSEQPASAAGEAWFAVARRDGRLLVAAHRGAAIIFSDAGPPVAVPEGSFAVNDDAQSDTRAPLPPPSKTAKQKPAPKQKGARPVSTSETTGWSIGGLSHSASVALVVGMGAGVAALAAGVALGGSNPSPSD